MTQPEDGEMQKFNPAIFLDNETNALLERQTKEGEIDLQETRAGDQITVDFYPDPTKPEVYNQKLYIQVTPPYILGEQSMEGWQPEVRKNGMIKK